MNSILIWVLIYHSWQNRMPTNPGPSSWTSLKLAMLLYVLVCYFGFQQNLGRKTRSGTRLSTILCSSQQIHKVSVFSWFQLDFPNFRVCYYERNCLLNEHFTMFGIVLWSKLSLRGAYQAIWRSLVELLIGLVHTFNLIHFSLAKLCLCIMCNVFHYKNDLKMIKI